MKHLRPILLLFLFVSVSSYLKAYNIRQISSRDGLSNSAVICLFEDKERYLWIGTYDGLNKYNGIDLKIYKPDINDKNSLSGNVIRRIVESKDGYLWIMTRWGLNKYSKKEDKVEAYFNEFKEDSVIASDSDGNIFVLTQSGLFYYYDFEAKQFKEILFPGSKEYKSWVSLIINSKDELLITNNGVIKQYRLDWTDCLKPQLVNIGKLDHTESVSYIFNNDNHLFIVDRIGDLFFIESGKKTFIRNIKSLIAEYGDITSVIFDDNDILIGFRTNGLIRLDYKKKYEMEKMPINCGVFSLLKDKVQDILWVGTDGQGVYACTKQEFTFKGINLEELPVKKQRPVRAIYSDQDNSLWLGTKGNGIIKIENYGSATEYDRQNVKHLTIDNGLSNNAVFAFEKSCRNDILWIGSSGPNLNYYSYNDKKIHILKNQGAIRFAEVHSLLETSDSVLWVASLNYLFKVNIFRNKNVLEIRNIRRYEFDIKNKQIFNQIYSICPENDSIMWLAMRGNGAIRLNCNSGEYKLITFEKNGIAPMDDVLSIYIDKRGNRWFGSSYGINDLKVLPDGIFDYRNFNVNDGLPNNTIHGILENSDGRLWLSSNAGIVLFDPIKETFRSFNQRTGLKVMEFSDNAYHKDEQLSRYFFGGVDGIVWIDYKEQIKKDNFLSINFSKLRVFNEEYNIDNFLEHGADERYLKLKHDQNFFTISFVANDFINGASGKYSYKLDYFNEVWMNSNNREAQFTNIPPGKYTLIVKYDDLSGGKVQIASLNIVIVPPWYLSIYAKIIYAIGFILLLIISFLYLKKKYERKKVKIEQQLDQKYKEEMYEGKLHFFTNITHEFCTPLTLIYTPSERLLNYAGSDSFIKRYAQIIKTNAERLNDLIQEIIDFRRMESGNKICKIEACDINDIFTEIAESFTDLAEENHINFSLNIPPATVWNSDRSCITKILNNLISNAFKYTVENGTIGVAVSVENEELIFRVYNTGRGIRKDDIPYIFNRYSVLDNVESNSLKGLSSRNGLGLAICKMMVDLLQGTIEVESEEGEYARFIVKLPFMGSDNINVANETNDRDKLIIADREREEVKSLLHNSGSRHTILIIDDNDDVLWLLEDILSEDYNIQIARDGEEGYNKLQNMMPDLVITDVMMPKQDGVSLTRLIKGNPYTMHIPLIILSAKSSIDSRIEGIDSGADAYISKPFDILYLKAQIRQLIDKKKKLQDYYNSSASAFDLVNGQLLAKEDRDFIQKAVQIVEKNISNAEFSPEDLADGLQVSIRTLYRKFKDLELLSPKDFIKDQRIVYAAKLILSTTLTIQEIMFSAGFTTRSHFYKEFTKRFDRSPKEYREDHSI
ncbi:hybrid sensor histidine kinase/response regulator transcription factor [Dysgonomonas sp. BGC7]|uniref:hybrid sensor histidine kinase/response regulator transcription factor n=1 Tax=Dysgonomonas sp. BGC7 TaxID=1658008 RepID=UPI0006837E6A|nr:hybrid sensor histidine kinase/response regulator transcription factor [Dysgonomonas sp. BGC7]MBD8390325.1 response regulator [Dysgonomonas sp. BGC7]